MRAATGPDGAAGCVLQVDGLGFAHAGQPPLFTHWSARLPAGVHLVCGGESRGKSTLLRLFAGALAPQQGHVRLRDASLDEAPARYRSEVFQTDPRTQAHDQVPAARFLEEVARAYPRFDHQALPALVEGLSLGEHLHKPLYMLSTGSRRKVWLAAALASRAALCLVDEPFAALDRGSIAFVVHTLNAAHPQLVAEHRAWVLADYAPHPDLVVSGVLDLGD